MTLLVFLSKNRKWLAVSNESLCKMAVKIAESDPKLKDQHIGVLNEFIETSMTDFRSSG